jgi:hypothetical protein
VTCQRCDHGEVEHEADSFAGTIPCTHNEAVEVNTSDDLETWAVTFCKCQDYIVAPPEQWEVAAMIENGEGE